jgi:capsular exopolysaccharide synthesis family protein
MHDYRAEERVDVRRYTAAVRRSRGLIVAIVVAFTGIVLGVSLLVPDVYRSNAKLLLEESTGLLGESDAQSVERRLSTMEALLTTPNVLQAAAASLPGETEQSLEESISAESDPQANIITVEASDGDPQVAARMANAVASAFLDQRANVERELLEQTREQLERQVVELQGEPGADSQVAAIRARISELSVGEGSVGSDLRLAQAAEPSSTPASPRPFRNAVLAFFAALFIAVLVALGRDQFTPRVSSSRELGRLLDLPVLVGVPYVSRTGARRRSLSGAELEAYETLAASLRLTLPKDRSPHVILVTGTLHAEGKTTATARLGRALAQSGNRTVLVSADLRVPRLQEMFNLKLGVGLSDLLAQPSHGNGKFPASRMKRATHTVLREQVGRTRGRLDVITSGAKSQEPGRLITSDRMADFIAYMRTLDYDYVLLDAPPLIGIVDSQVLARHVDEVLLVNRLDQLTLEQVQESRDVIDRFPKRPFGVVVIGVRGDVSPYYLQARSPLLGESAPT